MISNVHAAMLSFPGSMFSPNITNAADKDRCLLSGHMLNCVYQAKLD